MKKIFSIILSGICIVSATSCKKYLDINNNPNSATKSTPQLVLPQALTATAALIVNTGDYNSYGSSLNGYFGNAGGFGSLGVLISYAFTTGDYNGLFQNTFDNLEDYQYIINNSDPASTINAAANIMKAYDYQMLVDTYNDVPYSEALKGSDILQPKYDKGEDIYKDLGDKLDAAIAIMKAATTDNSFKTADVMFKGDVAKWAQFGNTLKLRLIIRSSGKVQFTKATPDASAGFLTTDAIVNPGYTKVAGKQNPFWDKWAYSETGGARTAANVYMPSPWILTFFSGIKFADDVRGKLLFNGYKSANTPTNQLGYTGPDAPKAPTPAFFFVGSNGANSTGPGLFKGPTAGQPLMLASESYFLQSEGVVRGIISGDAKTLYNNGIKASFDYLYQNAANTSTKTDAELTTMLNDYIAANPTTTGTKLAVDFDAYTTTEGKIRAIIDQKYVALAFLFGAEAWNEYRRTGYPLITGNTATTTFASTVSQATGPDKLPTRVLYPVSEYTYNTNNVPSGVSPYTDKIFWAK